MPAVTISFCLNDQRDRDLLDWLRSHTGSRSAVIRDTLRQGLGQVQAITIEDIRQAVRAELATYALQGGGSGLRVESSEPERAAAHLDALENRLKEWS